LVKLTRFQFALRDTGAEGTCKSTTIDAAEKFPGTIACLVDDKLILEDLRDHPELLTKVLSKKTLPKWARKWSKELRQEMTPVTIQIPGNGSSYEFILLVVEKQIQGLWKNAWFEPN
jgi:hypothetical protein